MKTLTQAMFTSAEAISSRLGPVSIVADKLLNRLAPQVTAQAESCPPAGMIQCWVYCKKTLACWIWNGAYQWTAVYGGNSYECHYGYTSECAKYCSPC